MQQDLTRKTRRVASVSIGPFFKRISVPARISMPRIQLTLLNRSLITFISSAILLMVPFAAAHATEGQKCTSNGQCAGSEYCNTMKICPGNNVTGTCKARPETCSKEEDPVTGCDGVEYLNACEAAANGQPVKVKRDRTSRHNKKRSERNQQNNND